MRDIASSLLFTVERYEKSKQSTIQARTRTTTKWPGADTPVLGFQHLELWEIKFCCFSATLSYAILVKQPKLRQYSRKGIPD